MKRTKMKSRKPHSSSTEPAVIPIQKPKDANQPLDFPIIGATLSPHADKYFNKVTQQKLIKAQLRKAKRRHKLKQLLKFSVLLLVTLVILSGAWVGWKVLRNADKFGGFFGLFSSHELNGEAQGRVNILLAGDSADDPGHQGADLTDSIMVVSIDTKNNTGFMLSIPRDLWVDIPGNGYQKINAAYEDGQADNFSASGYANGGMGLLEEVVNQDLGITCQYYALIDYTAFRDAVNAVGGITITINSPDPRGLYDPNVDLKLPNGAVALDGQEALNLARARGDGYGSYGFPQADFDRTQHQRQMLVAVEQKATTLGVLSNPVKIGDLFDAVGNNIQTDFKTNDVQALYSLAKKVNINNIQSLTYSESGNNALLQVYVAPDGEDALIPVAGIGNYSAIQDYDTNLITPQTTP
ncbi:MAG: LCP family protein [Candidatus Saccharimonadales bacterium]